MAAGTMSRRPARTPPAVTGLVAAIAAALALLVAAPLASANTFDAPWVASGSGTTTVLAAGPALATSDNAGTDWSATAATVHLTPASAAFRYANNGPGNFDGNWAFQAPAASARTTTLHYEWNGFHSFYQVTASLTKFVTHAGVTTRTTLVSEGPVNCCSAPSGGFSYSGDATFDVQPGDTYGFEVAGSHYDGTYALEGTLTLWSSAAVTHYAIDGAPAQTGRDALVPAPADHSGDGVHTVSYWSVDGDGTEEMPHKSATVRIDTTAPVTSVGTGGGSLDVSASDGGSGVAGTRCAVDPATAPASYGAMTDPCPTSLSGGSHDVYAASIDNAGNAETPVHQTVVIDATPPTTVIAPGVGEWGKTFSVVASDGGGSGVAGTRCAVDPVTAPASYGGMTSPCPASLSDGSHDVYAASIDNAGNAETPVHQTVQIDATAPTTSDDAPSGWQNAPATVTLAPSAGGSPATTHYTVDGGPGQTGTSVLVTAAADHSNDGVHTISYWSTDEAGNAETPNAATVRIDTTAPAVTLGAASPLTLSEGATRDFSYTVADPRDAAGLAATPSCGTGGTLVPGSATFAATGNSGSGSFSCAFPNGPASPTIGVTATDDLNGTGAAATRDVTVLNLAPRVRMDAANPLAAGDGATQTYRYALSDAGGDAISDVATGCGAHGTKVAGSDAHTNAAGSFACTFTDGPATSLVTARATDSDGQTGNAGTQTVTVAAPVIAPVVTPPVVSPVSSTPTGAAGSTGAGSGTPSTSGSAPDATKAAGAGAQTDGSQTPSGSNQAAAGTQGTKETQASTQLVTRYSGRYGAPRRRGRPAELLTLALTRTGGDITFRTRATLVCGTRRLTGLVAAGTGTLTGTTLTAVGTHGSRAGTVKLRAVFTGTLSGTTVRGTLRLAATRRVRGHTIACAAVRAAGITLAAAP